MTKQYEYRVYFLATDYCYIDVIADSKEHAEHIVLNEPWEEPEYLSREVDVSNVVQLNGE